MSDMNERGKTVIKRMYWAISPALRAVGINIKGQREMQYWRQVKAREGVMDSSQYEQAYTTYFGLSKDFYKGKKVLDIGCGPRGSLEWADMAAERVGLDPLVDQYRELGIDKHKMTYVNSGSETIPFPDGYFDVVCSFNSIDHVDNLNKTIEEITRVVKPGGTFLLLVEIHDRPTLTEPHTLNWEFTKRFQPGFQVVDEQHLASKEGGIYQTLGQMKAYDHNDSANPPGWLTAKFVKR